MQPKESTTLRIPGWLVGPLVGIIAGLLSFAGSYRMVEAHVADRDVHVNRPLVEYRLGQVEEQLRITNAVLIDIQKRLPPAKP